MIEAFPTHPRVVDTVRATVVLGLIVVLSRWTDMLRIRCIIDRLSPSVRRQESDQRLERRIHLATDLASKAIPRSTCGARALTMYALLARDRYKSDIMIGVRRTSDGRLHAHAWIVNSAGTVISEPHGQEPVDWPLHIDTSTLGSRG